MTRQRIAHIALVVDDYDDAIKFYTEKLNFNLIEDTRLSDSKRWVLVGPPGAKECCLLLAKAADDKQRASIGNQTAAVYFFFCVPMTSTGTIHRCGNEEFVLSGSRKTRRMGLSRSSRICMVIFGICYNPATAKRTYSERKLFG